MRVVLTLVTLMSASLWPSLAHAGEPPEGDGDRGGYLDAEATTETEPEPLPPAPECWWESLPATASDRAREQSFWDQIDGGDHSDDVVVFLEDGTLQRTFSTTQKTFILRIKVCTDPADERAGQRGWAEVGPPNPTVYWDVLTERVTRRVPVPEPSLGFDAGPDGTVRIAVQVGLWIAVSNADDVVARAEPAPGVWAETRARLDRIEFVTGTGTTVTQGCEGAGTPLPPTASGGVEQGGCGYTYTTVDELGVHTAIVRAIWTVTNSTSTGATQQRDDIVLETPVMVDVFEIQTVGTG